MPVYNKLIRDRILEIIEADGLSYNARTLAPEEHLTEIKKKLYEEAKEFDETTNEQDAIEEMAELQKVIVKDIICLGDKLTTSDTPGVACAIKYENLEERQFNTKSIGKVIGVHNVYNKATVLLDIH